MVAVCDDVTEAEECGFHWDMGTPQRNGTVLL